MLGSSAFCSVPRHMHRVMGSPQSFEFTLARTEFLLGRTQRPELIAAVSSASAGVEREGEEKPHQFMGAL